MLEQETHGAEQKISAILEILSGSDDSLVDRVISRRLKNKGIELSERAVRYHLKIMNERGLIKNVRNRTGMAVARPELEELNSDLACDKTGLLSGKIELLAYLTTFNMDEQQGDIPVDISFFSRDDFALALNTMKAVFKTGLCVSDLVSVGYEGEKLGQVTIPQGKVGFATVSNVVIIGSLLKAGIPVDCKFGGLVEIRDYVPNRFVDLIEYHGSTIDPVEVFISSKMTNVANITSKGRGKVLAGFHEIPMLSRPAAEAVIGKLKTVGLCKMFMMGKTTETICEIPVNLNKIGLVLFSGLNPIAAVVEQGINVITRTMSSVIDIGALQSLESLESK